ncbi:MAG: cobalamin-binding protein [Acidobacteria bacterium]|nr:cobalamin-binding protein [Acidobacteriota bacterium]
MLARFELVVVFRQLAGFALLAALAAPAAVRAGAQATAPPANAATPAKTDVTDEVGRRVSIPVPVRRIVSLAPNLTETIYALGAQDRLVGVTDYCDYPPEAQQKARVGGAVNPNLEQIVALKPDLVLAQAFTLNRRETVDALERLGVAVYSANAHSVDGILDSTRHLAEVIGAVEQSTVLLKNLRTRLGELKRHLAGRPPKRVLFVVWSDPLVTVGRQTFIADALRLAGAESVVETEQDWPRLSLEEVVRLQPDFLVFASSHSKTVRTTVEDLSQRPGWRGLDAVRNRRIAVISDAINRPAPRLVEALEDLARQLHPDAFEEKSKNRKAKIENRKNAAASGESPIFSFLFSLFAFHRVAP